MPDYLDEALARTTRTRQRPAWSSLERWLPVQSTLRFTPVPGAWLLVVLGLIIAIAAAALWIGSRPAPATAVRPGTQRCHRVQHDGDIYAVDVTTRAERLLVGGKTIDFGPTFSRDGTKLLFLRVSGDPGDDAGVSLAVADSDGTAVHEVSPKVRGLDWVDWSPDGRQIAFLSARPTRPRG